MIEPDWKLPPGVRAFITTRSGGFSAGAWQSFNLAQHVGDDAHAVDANRALLLAQLQQHTGVSPLALQWVQQVHGTAVVRAEGHVQTPPPTADAVYTKERGIACAVLTADCLPVLFCAADGSEIAVAHAGWRGLSQGILEATVQQFETPAASIVAWLGPAIAQCHFEVGTEVREAFCQGLGTVEQQAVHACFRPGTRPDKWMADLYGLARLRLRTLGLTQVSGEPQCTVCQSERFYSYRHQPLTGRFATLIVRTA